MNNWQSDKKWSDQFIPEIKQILGHYLIGEPPISDDQEKNTDLMVLKMDAVRIGCRIRDIGFMDQFSDEFTIRAGRPSGAKVEFTKIIEGWGDYFFYGFGDNNGLKKWTLADLNVFRLWYATQLYGGNRPGKKQDNHDNSSFFLIFKWTALPSHFIIGQSNSFSPVSQQDKQQT